MSHFTEDKTSLEILLEEKMKREDPLVYNFNLELENDDFVEISIKTAKEESHGDRIFTSEQLPPEFRGWLSSRPKFLFGLLKQRRLKAFKKELRSIWKRLRQDFRAR
jgi:hypothetical protein